MALPNENVYGNLITRARLLSTRRLMSEADTLVHEMAALTLINL